MNAAVSFMGVCILGYTEPQNWFNPGVRGVCIQFYLA